MSYPVRRSLRIAAQKAANVDATLEEIQENLRVQIQSHVNTINHAYKQMCVDIERFRDAVLDTKAFDVTDRQLYQIRYLNQIEALSKLCYTYRRFVMCTIDTVDERMLNYLIPHVSNIKRLRKSLYEFVESLRHDTENFYIIKKIVVHYCEHRMKEIKEYMN
jgi:hypothetical protein